MRRQEKDVGPLRIVEHEVNEPSLHAGMKEEFGLLDQKNGVLPREWHEREHNEVLDSIAELVNRALRLALDASTITIFLLTRVSGMELPEHGLLFSLRGLGIAPDMLYAVTMFTQNDARQHCNNWRFDAF